MNKIALFLRSQFEWNNSVWAKSIPVSITTVASQAAQMFLNSDVGGNKNSGRHSDLFVQAPRLSYSSRRAPSPKINNGWFFSHPNAPAQVAWALDEQIINRNRGHVSIVKLERVIFLFRKARPVCNRESEREAYFIARYGGGKRTKAG